MTEPLPVPETLDPRRRRIIFRATHRGTHENDIMIGTFVKARIVGMTEAELNALEELMEHPDADLADWLTGRRSPPPDVDTAMFRAIRDAALQASARR